MCGAVGGWERGGGAGTRRIHRDGQLGAPAHALAAGSRQTEDHIAAVELAKEYGTEKSPAFINAVLDRIWKTTLEERGSGEHA